MVSHLPKRLKVTLTVNKMNTKAWLVRRFLKTESSHHRQLWKLNKWIKRVFIFLRANDNIVSPCYFENNDIVLFDDGGQSEIMSLRKKSVRSMKFPALIFIGCWNRDLCFKRQRIFTFWFQLASLFCPVFFLDERVLNKLFYSGNWNERSLSCK